VIGRAISAGLLVVVALLAAAAAAAGMVARLPAPVYRTVAVAAAGKV
jgi:hypothetical protein